MINIFAPNMLHMQYINMNKALQKYFSILYKIFDQYRFCRYIEFLSCTKCFNQIAKIKRNLVFKYLAD